MDLDPPKPLSQCYICPKLSEMENADMLLFTFCMVTFSPVSVAGLQYILCICSRSSCTNLGYYITLSNDKYPMDCSNCWSFDNFSMDV